MPSHAHDLENDGTISERPAKRARVESEDRDIGAPNSARAAGLSDNEDEDEQTASTGPPEVTRASDLYLDTVSLYVRPVSLH